MTNNKDQLHRQWALLQKIPVRPAGKTAKQLLEELADDGYEVSIRMVQRDLKDLKRSPFGVSCDEKGVGNNPNLWYFERDSKLHLLPAMTTQMAFTLLFSRSVLNNMIPPSVMLPMDSIFDKAESTLRPNMTTYKHWDRYVKHDSRSLPLIPAEILPGVMDGCLEGVLKGLRLSISYKARFKEEKQYEVNPLGVVFRDSVVYLVCTMWEYDDVRQLALHRIRDLRLLVDQKAVKPKGFDLDEYIKKEGAFQYGAVPGKTIKVILKFNQYAAKHLAETPLSDDQVIKPDGDHAIVSATVLDSGQLRWWLLSFGGYVEVLKPKKLRDEFSAIAQQMVNNYQ